MLIYNSKKNEGDKFIANKKKLLCSETDYAVVAEEANLIKLVRGYEHLLKTIKKN